MKEGKIVAADVDAAVSKADAVALGIDAGGAEAPEPRKRRWRMILMLSVPILLALAGGWYWLNSGRYVSTDNAYVQQDKISITAEVGGPIVEVAVHENQRVKKGDLLFRIDQRPYRIALEQAEADLAAARVRVGELKTELAGTGADIEGARANVGFAQRAFERQDELLDRGFTTRARYDEALHTVQEAKERLANAQADAANARAAIQTGGASAQPAIAAAQAARDKALLDLKRTAVRAPADGIVSQTERLQPGQMVASGLPVLTLVRGGDAWIEANYKETDLAHMRIGQPVEVHLDAYPEMELHGRVASIGAGTGSEFSVLPAQNATGNWVKVTQRVPVRIAIEGEAERPLIAGLSADVSVDTEGQVQPPQQFAGR